MAFILAAAFNAKDANRSALLVDVWAALYPNADERAEVAKLVQIEVACKKQWAYSRHAATVIGLDAIVQVWPEHGQRERKGKRFDKDGRISVADLKIKVEELRAVSKTRMENKNASAARRRSAEETAVAVRDMVAERGAPTSYSGYSRGVSVETRGETSVTMNFHKLGINDLDLIAAYLRNGGNLSIKCNVTPEEATDLVDMFVAA